MELGASTALTQAKSLCGKRTRPGQAARHLSTRFVPFINAAAPRQPQTLPQATDLSRRQALQQLIVAAAVLPLNAVIQSSAPQAAEAALVQFPSADLRNSYYLVRLIDPAAASLLPVETTPLSPAPPPEGLAVMLCCDADGICHCNISTGKVSAPLLQVRAGEGQCEADNYVLTNTVFKTSISNGLSKTGKRQVARQVARHRLSSKVWTHPGLDLRLNLVPFESRSYQHYRS